MHCRPFEDRHLVFRGESALQDQHGENDVKVKMQALAGGNCLPANILPRVRRVEY